MVKVLGFDLGASSGRAIIGTLNQDNILELDVVYRFPNRGIQIGNSLCWDIKQLWQDVLNSLKVYVRQEGVQLDSIGFDTWGVDYALLDGNNELIGNIYHYRDKRNEGMLEEMFKIVPKKEIFNQTGIQFLVFNTAPQLLSMVFNKSPEIVKIKTLLMLPDYFNFLLSGKITAEYSISSTTQLYNPILKDWDKSLIEKLGFNPDWFLPIDPPGIIIGNLKSSLAEDVGLNPDTKIISVLGHDTGSAIAAVPVDMNRHKDWAYLSSGTWSLIGIESNEPIINDKALEHNFTNEGGINSTIRFLKNISGLWMIQECKRIWDGEGINLDWERIANKAQNAPSFQCFINPDDKTFLNPINMVEAIEEFCKIHNQNPPRSIGDTARAIFESLAFKYKEIMLKLEDIIGKKIEILYIIGGGSQNELLNQFTANSLNIPIKAGPSEATAIGNILVQALALGKVKDLKELRLIVKNSFPPKEYIPKDAEEWEKAYVKYLEIIK